MRIALNAWFINQPATGSGQYLTHLLAEYGARYAQHKFLLCEHASHAKTPRSPNSTDRPASITPLDALEQPTSCFERQILRTPFDGYSRHLAKLWFEQVSFPHACRRWGPDAIHVPYWASPLFSPPPTVVTVHDLIPVLLPGYRGGPSGRLYTYLVTQSARRAAYVLTDSQVSRQDIVRHLHIPPHRVKAIHLAADDRFRPVRDPRILEQVRCKYALPSCYMLYLGGFDVRKNVTGTLRAFARLDIREADLVIAGRLPRQDSDSYPDPRPIAGELNILDRVRFTGWVDKDDKPALYSAAIAFLFPSYYEGFGLPPLEAMACGTPVIVSDRGSLPEVVGAAGLCIDPDDVSALAWAMHLVVSDTTLHEELQRASLAQARRFSWQRTAQATMAAYRRVAPR